jgi:hypothetical protein
MIALDSDANDALQATGARPRGCQVFCQRAATAERSRYAAKAIDEPQAFAIAGTAGARGVGLSFPGRKVSGTYIRGNYSSKI